jgi:hypothetical protein
MLECTQPILIGYVYIHTISKIYFITDQARWIDDMCMQGNDSLNAWDIPCSGARGPSFWGSFLEKYRNSIALFCNRMHVQCNCLYIVEREGVKSYRYIASAACACDIAKAMYIYNQCKFELMW